MNIPSVRAPYELIQSKHLHQLEELASRPTRINLKCGCGKTHQVRNKLAVEMADVVTKIMLEIKNNKDVEYGSNS